MQYLAKLIWVGTILLSVFFSSILFDYSIFENTEDIIFTNYVILFCIINSIEKIIPYKRIWNNYEIDRKIDNYPIVHDIMHTLIGELSSIYIGEVIANKLIYKNTNTYFKGLDIVSTLFIVSIIIEFFLYWIHRIFHIYSKLWEFHAIHHAVNRLNSINTTRFHFVNETVTVFFINMIFNLWGIETYTRLMYMSIYNTVGILSHCNINCNNQIFNKLFNTPEQHRLHHSKSVEESNSNYGEIWIIWDVVFNTYRNCKNDINIGRYRFKDKFISLSSKNFVLQLLYPFINAFNIKNELNWETHSYINIIDFSIVVSSCISIYLLKHKLLIISLFLLYFVTKNANKLNENIKDTNLSTIYEPGLEIESLNIRDIVEEYGTPLNIISENTIIHTYKNIEEEFVKNWGNNFEILPSVKANYCVHIIKLLAKFDCGFDVSSIGEMYSVSLANANLEKVSLNGNGKLNDPPYYQLLKYSIENNVKITIDDPVELVIIYNICAKLDKKVNVRYRIRPEFVNMHYPTDFAEEWIPTELANMAYKNGIPVDTLLKCHPNKYSEYINVVGLHIHLGRHSSDLEYWKHMMIGYADIIGKLSKEWGGWLPKEIDIGGGIPSNKDPMGKNIDRSIHVLSFFLWIIWKISIMVCPNFRWNIAEFFLNLKKKYNTEIPNRKNSIGEYANTISSTLKTELEKNNIDHRNLTLQIEPGRMLFNSSGIHVTKVTSIKSQHKPIEWIWIMVDTTESFFYDSVLEHSKLPYFWICKNITKVYDYSNTFNADVVGLSCNFDRLIEDAICPSNIDVGDLLVFFETGAYQDASSSNFNALPRPGMISINKDIIKIVKKREKVEEIFFRDVF